MGKSLNNQFNNQQNKFIQFQNPDFFENQQQSMKFKVLQYALAICSIVWIILDAIYGEQFFKWNYSFAYSMQNGDSDPSLPKYKIFTIISYLGQEELIAIFVLFGFIFFANKIQALKILIGTMITVYLICLLKLWYKDPRPYFVYPDLQGIGCDPEFGKPSGHAFITSVLFYLMFDSFVNKKIINPTNAQIDDQQIYKETKVVDIEMIPQDSNNSPQLQGQSLGSKKIVYQERFLNSFIYFPIYLILIFLVGFARVILGVHSFNQVLLGWAYSLLYILFYRLKLEIFIENSLQVVIEKKFNNDKQKLKYLFFITVIYIISIALAMIFYYIADNQLTQNQKNEYKANFMSHSYCQDSFDAHTFLAGECILDCAVLSLIYGVYVSCISLKGTYQPELWNQSYKNLKLSKKIIRVIITLVLVAIPYILFSLYKIDNQYLYFLFRSNLKYLFVGLFLIRLQPFAFKITKLEIDGDLLKLLPNSN
ncbi:PAP2 superfamily protein (macronuclear) [Tetrahymena thermophila SB210]|uniref:PAP2 superfamily protein n=1 Tax=Tetrahymena thermophila (strain SB210) TaxID=312017 RepID=I7MH15_TETTS|nr:PAP2 superfamily protein [Tetrahymena thermophila SB210]EAS02417.2 PAP2 superfamily protein [Tetrahymena thermophila SB210]|eukprot:XP_001022662.2 PAP2 superfamily protein [Tetrahymena thermophila SB210]